MKRLDEDKREFLGSLVEPIRRLAESFAWRHNMGWMVDDVLGEAYLSACRIAIVTDLSRPEARGYLITRVKYDLITLYNKESGRPQSSSLLGDIETEDDSPEPFVHPALNLLTDKQSICLEMRYFGYTFRDIADRFGCSRPNIMDICRRGIEVLRRAEVAV